MSAQRSTAFEQLVAAIARLSLPVSVLTNVIIQHLGQLETLATETAAIGLLFRMHLHVVPF